MMSFLVVLFVVAVTAADPAPCVVNWNKDRTYGPDGPWQAVTVKVGTDASGKPLSSIDLYPEGYVESFVFTNEYCGGSTKRCPPSFRGQWNFNDSKTTIQNIDDKPAPISAYESRVAWSQTDTATEILDTLSLNTTAGLVEVANTTISAIHDENLRLPNEGTKSFDNATGWTFPSYLHSQNIVPSNSVGLHYGSATTGPEGSLTWGGYDQSRVISSVGSYALYMAEGLILPSLLDISIGVETGTSPFNATTATGLMERNNTIGPALSTLINSSITYMYMSPRTCANIASHLPATYQPDLALYTWNTHDPAYTRIISSPAYPAFTFQPSTPDPGNLTMKVPFTLLNLPLEPPIVPNKRQYFPCQPFHALDGSGYFFLGRSFLQAAFLAINWNQSTFFLAQAPGPGVETPDVKNIGAGTTMIQGLQGDAFAKSWEKHWTPLSASTPITGSTEKSAVGGGRGLSGGPKVGIAVAIVVAGLMIVGLIACLFLRRKRRHATATDATKSPGEASEVPEAAGSLRTEIAGQMSTNEVQGDGAKHEKMGAPLHEAGGRQMRVVHKKG